MKILQLLQKNGIHDYLKNKHTPLTPIKSIRPSELILLKDLVIRFNPKICSK
jgi:hypothetical protein